MADLAQLGIEFQAKGHAETNRALDDYARKAEGAERATDSLAGAQRRGSGALSQMMAAIQADVRAMRDLQIGLAEGAMQAIKMAGAADQAARGNDKMAASTTRAGRAARAAAADFATLYDAYDKDFVAQYQAGAQTFIAQTGKMGQTARASSYHILNLGQQLADVGVMAGLGARPMSILISQGPQIAAVFAQAKTEGVGFAAVLRQLLGIVRPFAPALAVIGTTAAVAFGAAALSARALNKETGDLTKGMGLTQKQLEELEEQGVNTGVTIGDVFRGTFNYIRDGAAQALAPVGRFFSNLFDLITVAAADAVKVTVGGFVGAFEAIMVAWRRFPMAFGDLIVSGVNVAIRAIEGLLNRAGEGINSLIDRANAVSQRFGGPQLGRVGQVSLAGVANPFAGQAAGGVAAVGAAFREGYATGSRAADSVMKGLGEAIRDAARDRIREAAGKPGKAGASRSGSRGPRDMAEERTAELAQLLEQAKMEELRAQLALTRDVRARAVIEKQIIAAEAAVKQAQLGRTRARVEQDVQDKRLTEEKGKELLAQLDAVKAVQDRVAGLKARAVDEELARTLARQAADLAQAERDASLDVLKARAGAAKSGLERHKFEVEILAQEQAAERARLEAITEANGYSAQEVAIARKRLGVLEEIFAADREALRHSRRLSDTYREAASAMGGVAQAFERHDWVGLLDSLRDTINLLKFAFSSAGTTMDRISAVAGVANAVGGMVGGRAGRGISGAASGALAGAQLGSIIPGIGTGIGAVVGGLLGGISSLLGGNSQRRAERRAREQQAAQEAAARAQQIANTRRELEIRLLELSGDKVAALARARQAEIDAADPSLRALIRQVQEAEDAANRRAFLLGTEIEYLTLTGKAVEAVAKARAEELRELDPALRAMQELRWAVADTAAEVERAKDALRQALEMQLGQAQERVVLAQERVASLRERITEQYQREASALEELIDQAGGWLNRLRGFRREMEGGATSGLSPENAYLAAKAQFEDVQRRARLGDPQAMGEFVDVAQQFRSASRSYFGAGPGFFEDQAAILEATKAAEAVAGRTLDNAKAQLAALDELVGTALGTKEIVESLPELIAELQKAEAAAKQAEEAARLAQAELDALNGVNTSVLSVADAVRGLEAAQNAHAAAVMALGEAIKNMPPPVITVDAGSVSQSGGYTSTAGDYAAYVRGNADLLALYNAGTGMARGRSIEEFGLYHWANYGSGESRGVRPFATGGEFMVGGFGSTDSQHVRIVASPNETVSVRTPHQVRQSEEAGDRIVAAVEKVEQKLDAIVYELKADKRQRGAAAKETTDALGEVRDELAGLKRAAARGGAAR